MKSYRKGAKNEHKSIKLLEAAGYCCSRAAGSIGIFDIIAIGASDILLVQVKSNCWPRRAEIEKITNFICPVNCQKVIHRWRDYGRQPDTRII